MRKRGLSIRVVLLSSACVTVPVMAQGEFRALSQTPAAVAPMTDHQLADIEGGNTCTSSAHSVGGIVRNINNCNEVKLNGQDIEEIRGVLKQYGVFVQIIGF